MIAGVPMFGAASLTMFEQGFPGGDARICGMTCIHWTISTGWCQNFQKSCASHYMPVPRLVTLLCGLAVDNHVWRHTGGCSGDADAAKSA